jgi:hypothetical protein
MRAVFSEVSSLFHPINLEKEELVCLHGCSSRCNDFDKIILQEAKFPRQDRLTKMEYFLPRGNA